MGRIDEPQVADDYAAVLSHVAEAHQPVILRRRGQDLVAVVPLEHLELIGECLAQREVEQAASRIPWERLSNTLRPPQSWFDDEDDNPFQPDQQPIS